MKAQFNANRPVQYFIPRHSVVSDGWKEIGNTRYYHINYGWADNTTTWYLLDNIYGGDPEQEQMIEGILPNQHIEGAFFGTYPCPSFPYVYFAQDAISPGAIFEPGWRVQFLPNIKVTCTSTVGGSIAFKGIPSWFGLKHTILFTRGDRTKGVRIYNGTLKLNGYGSIKFY
jgi:hypothetical protein